MFKELKLYIRKEYKNTFKALIKSIKQGVIKILKAGTDLLLNTIRVNLKYIIKH